MAENMRKKEEMLKQLKQKYDVPPPHDFKPLPLMKRSHNNEDLPDF